MVKGQRFRHFATDGERPGIGAQATRVRRRIGFIEAEFIKIIVTGDLIFRGKRQISLPLGGFSKLQGLARWRWWAVVAFKPVQQVGLRGGRKESAVALIPSIFSTWRRLSIKTDSAVTSASVSFFFSWCPPSCVFLSMTETAMNGEYVTKNCTLG